MLRTASQRNILLSVQPDRTLPKPRRRKGRFRKRKPTITDSDSFFSQAGDETNNALFSSNDGSSPGAATSRSGESQRGRVGEWRHPPPSSVVWTIEDTRAPAPHTPHHVDVVSEKQQLGAEGRHAANHIPRTIRDCVVCGISTDRANTHRFKDASFCALCLSRSTDSAGDEEVVSGGITSRTKRSQRVTAAEGTNTCTTGGAYESV